MLLAAITPQPQSPQGVRSSGRQRSRPVITEVGFSPFVAEFHPPNDVTGDHVESSARACGMLSNITACPPARSESHNRTKLCQPHSMNGQHACIVPMESRIASAFAAHRPRHAQATAPSCESSPSTGRCCVHACSVRTSACVLDDYMYRMPLRECLQPLYRMLLRACVQHAYRMLMCGMCGGTGGCSPDRLGR